MNTYRWAPGTRQTRETLDHQALQLTSVVWALVFKVIQTHKSNRSNPVTDCVILAFTVICAVNLTILSNWLQDHQVTQVSVVCQVLQVTRELQDSQEYQEHQDYLVLVQVIYIKVNSTQT